MEERDTNFEEKIMRQQYNNMATFPYHSEGQSEANRGHRQNAVALYDYWQQPSNSFSADSASSSSLSSGSFDHSSEGSPASSPDSRWRPSGASLPPIHHHHYHHHGGQFPRDHRSKKISSPPTTLPKWEPAQCVALDAEMVGVGQYGEDSSIARVVIVDWYGNVLFDEYIKQTQQVTDYRTFISGITEGDLDGAKLSLRDARKHILKILYGRFLIGHGLRNDLKALGISHPWWLIRDVSVRFATQSPAHTVLVNLINFSSRLRAMSLSCSRWVQIRHSGLENSRIFQWKSWGRTFKSMASLIALSRMQWQPWICIKASRRIGRG
jgi:hypothetical protein